MLIHKRYVRSSRCLPLLLVAGCATVNPRPDYDQLGQQVENAVGHGRVWQPEGDAAADARVNELLSDGLTADEAAQVALLNNLRLRAALYDIGVARADVVQAGLFSNPTLFFSLGFPDGGGVANFQTNLAQNIADLWLIPSRRRAAERDLDRAILDAARQASTIALDAKVAYFRAVRATRAHEIAAEQFRVTERLLEFARAAQEAGSGSEVDVTLMRKRVLERNVNVRRAALAAKETRYELTKLLGLTLPDDQLDLAEPLPEDSAASVALDELLTAAQTNRLDLRAAAEAVAAARERLTQERLRFLKAIEVGFALERDERRTPEGRNILADTIRSSIAAGQWTAPEIEPRSSQPDEVMMGPTFGIELPLFDQNQAQIARADYEWQQADAARSALLVELTQDARLAIERANFALHTAAFYRHELLPIEARTLDLTREAYRAGRTQILVVLEAERTLLETSGQYLLEQETAALSIIELERVAGRPARELLRGRDRDRMATEPAEAGASP